MIVLGLPKVDFIGFARDSHLASAADEGNYASKSACFQRLIGFPAYNLKNSRACSDWCRAAVENPATAVAMWKQWNRCHLLDRGKLSQARCAYSPVPCRFAARHGQPLHPVPGRTHSCGLRRQTGKVAYPPLDSPVCRGVGPTHPDELPGSPPYCLRGTARLAHKLPNM